MGKDLSLFLYCMTILLYCSRVRWVGSPWALDRHTHCLRSIQPAWTPGSCSHTLTIPPSLQRRPGEGYVTHPGAPPETHWDLTHWPLGDKAIILTFETHLTDWYYFCMKDTWDHVSEHRQQGLSISWDWLSWVENTTEPNVSSGTMVWYLMTPTSPSHYLNHCWLAVSMVHKYSFDGNFTSNNPAIKHVKRCLVSMKITSNFIQISQGLTPWGRVMHICDNELGHHWFMLSPSHYLNQWWIELSVGPLGTKFSEIFIEIKTFLLMNLYLKVSSAKVTAILPQPQHLSKYG